VSSSQMKSGAAGGNKFGGGHELGAVNTGESELWKLVGYTDSTDRFGSGIGEALRTHADYLRVHRAGNSGAGL
jgi:hypothetical protein